MKILWHSNAPWVPTGYGSQCGMFSRRMLQAGHDVAISAFYGLEGRQLAWEGMQVYPKHLDGFGNDVIMAHAGRHFQGDTQGGLILPLMDVWVLSNQAIARANVACWTPVDHDPLPQPVLRFYQVSGAVPIAMSRHGQEALEAAGIACPWYVPHAVETAIYHPMGRDEARDLLGWPKEAFIVGCVAANKGTPARKGLPQVLQSFAAFSAKHDDALLYLHTEMTGAYGGVNLMELIELLRIPHGKIVSPNQYQQAVLGIPEQRMAQTYAAMDVLVNPSMGEGFGITPLEAQACGVPVIVGANTAQREVGAVGWQLDGQPWWSPQAAFQYLIPVEAVLWGLEQAYTSAASLRDAAAAHAAQYDADLVYANHWEPTLTAAEEWIGSRWAEDVTTTVEEL